MYLASGSFKEDHWLRGVNDTKAGVEVDIISSEKYQYSYSLNPGKEEASQNLNVENATRIDAYAEVRSPNTTSKSEISVLNGSLINYYSTASVTKDGHASNQSFMEAKGDEVEVQSKARYGSKTVSVETKVWSGDIKNYWDRSGIYVKVLPDSNKSDYMLYANQQYQVDIQPLTGRFLSYAKSDSKNVARESNYGTQYDVKLSSDGTYLSGISKAFGKLTYHVDITNPYANKIQGALDAASVRDSILVAPGKYNENLNITKSVDIIGSGADKTFIDGQKRDHGHVAKVIEASAIVKFKGTTFQNGSSVYGGGILNHGVLTLDSCDIVGNDAYQIGGGIYNYANIVMYNCQVYNNFVGYYGNIINGGCGPGGGIFNEGTITMLGGRVSSNLAAFNYADINCGGGVYNGWKFNMNGGQIVKNVAKCAGGGINNNFAWVYLNCGDISGNHAAYGGGIYDQFFFQYGVKGNESIVHDNVADKVGDDIHHWW